MSEHGGTTYRPWEPQRSQQEAHSPASKLPEGDLVFFLLDTVPQLDVRRFYAPYAQAPRGAPPFDPALMVCLLLYAYSVGVFSLWWDRYVQIFAPSVTFASGMWRRSKTCLCRWFAWQVRRAWCSGATSQPMARKSQAMRRVTRR